MGAASGTRQGWGVRNRRQADALGLVLLVVGIVLHCCLLLALGSATGHPVIQFGALTCQVAGAVLVLLRREWLPQAFWTWVGVAATPLVVTVLPFYPRATGVVLPILFLIVLATSVMLMKAAARLVVAEALVLMGWVLSRTQPDVGLLITEGTFFMGTLVVAHVLLVRGIDAQEQLVARLDRLAHTDTLTGLMSRRAFDRALEGQLAASPRTSLLLVDIDHFKTINDNYGHATGDAALRHVAELLTRGTRTDDAVVGRLGGDELAVLLRGCTAADATRRAHDLVNLIASSPLHRPGDSVVHLGVSIGVASGPTHDGATLFADADMALYSAKGNGRGQARSA